MILRSLRAEHIRRHLRPVEIVFDERFTVVEGPNEAGKSTLLTALEYAFFRRSSATGEDLKQLEPWEAEGLRPRIVVQFTFRGEEYRLDKNWSGRGTTVIGKCDAAGRWTPFKEDDADDWLLEIFAGEAGAQGFRAFKSTHLGLAHLLFAPQGRILVRGDEKEIALNAGARGRLAALAGAASQTADETAMIETVRWLYDAVWTKTGKRKASADSLRYAGEAAGIERELDVARRERDDFAELGERYEEERRALDEHRAARDDCNRRFEETLPHLTAASDARVMLERAVREEQQARSRFDGVAEQLRGIDELDVRREVWNAEVAPKAAALAAAAAAAGAARDAYEAANAAYAEVSAPNADLDSARAAHDRAQRVQIDRLERERLGTVVGEVEACDRALEALGAPADVPTAENLAGLKAIADRRAELEAELRIARTTVSIRAFGAISVEHDGVRTSLKAGESADFAASRVALTIPGVAAIEARGPLVDVREAREEAARLDERLADVVRSFGSADYGVLVRRVTEAESREQDRARLRREREARLDGRELGELRATVAELTARIADVEESGDPSELAARVQSQAAAREERVQSARATFAAAKVAVDTADGRLKEAERGHNEALRRVQELDAQLAALLNGADRDGLRERRREAERTWQDAARRGETAQAAYEPYREFDDPSAELAALHREKEAHQKLVDDRERSVAQLEARFTQLQDRGVSNTIAELEQRLEASRGEQRRAEEDENGIRLLHATVQHVLQHRAAGLAQPMERRVAPWFERVTGKALTGIRLGEHHELVGLDLAGIPRAISPDHLSTGAADQLGALVRLAFADLLAEGEALPVILDDPLSNADKRRRTAMIAIMREVSQRAQIVVFTCRVEDYLQSGARITSITEAGDLLSTSA